MKPTTAVWASHFKAYFSFKVNSLWVSPEHSQRKSPTLLWGHRAASLSVFVYGLLEANGARKGNTFGMK